MNVLPNCQRKLKSGLIPWAPEKYKRSNTDVLLPLSEFWANVKWLKNVEYKSKTRPMWLKSSSWMWISKHKPRLSEAKRKFVRNLHQNLLVYKGANMTKQKKVRIWAKKKFLIEMATKNQKSKISLHLLLKDIMKKWRVKLPISKVPWRNKIEMRSAWNKNYLIIYSEI